VEIVAFPAIFKNPVFKVVGGYPLLGSPLLLRRYCIGEDHLERSANAVETIAFAVKQNRIAAQMR